jgi:DNA polymerase-3 subunit delta'
VAQIAKGSFTEALRLATHHDNDLFPAVRDLFNHIFTNNGAGLARFATEWAQAGREQQKNFLEYVIQLLEQAIRARYTPQVPLSLPEAEAAFVRKLAGTKTTFEAFGLLTEALSNTIFYIERNANSKIQLHTLALRMLYIIQGRQVPVV